MNSADLAKILREQTNQRVYIRQLIILEQSVSLIKARLYISPDLFVQIYRNDRFDSTNLVLIHNQQRIYGRDHIGGVWHRHPVGNPHSHDTSSEGRRDIHLSEFLDEVETILADMNLP
ncbi:MAG TPA: hypothetical protein ENK32_09020 [Anaerolineae bacterium]|nr:hypothetical protein [Anaerolineae bacterium]